MAEAFASAFLCGIGGVVVFLAMLGLCKLAEDLADVDQVAQQDPTEPRE